MLVSGWLTYAVDSLRNKFKAARQGCQPAESGGAQAETERGRAWRSGVARAETERGEYILSVRLNQAAGFIIYRLKFIFRPGKRRRAAAELPGRISGCIAYRDVCRTGARVVLCRRDAVLFRGRNAVLCRDGWKCVLFIF